MIINNSLMKQLALQSEQKAKVLKEENEAAVTVKETKEQEIASSELISISKKAELLEKARSIMYQTEDADMEKVEYFRNLLKENKYEIDNVKLASALLKALSNGGDE